MRAQALALPLPRLRPVSGLGEAAQAGLLLQRPAGADVVGGFVDQPVEDPVAGQAEEIIDAVRLAPVHRLGAAVVAVAADGDVGRGPAAADLADQPAQMAADLLTGWRLAGAQDHRHRPARRRIVDMDRQEAACVVMRVEQRELLVAVDNVAGVVDVECHLGGRRRIAVEPQIEHHPAEPDHAAQIGRVLPAGHRRLRAQVPAAVRQPAAGELERRIEAQAVEIVGVLPAAGDGEDARPQNVGQRMRDPAGVAAVRDRGGELGGDAEPSLGFRQQHHATVRGDPATVERRGDLLAPNGWKRERQARIVDHGGCGRPEVVEGLASATESYALSTAYATSAIPFQGPS